MSACKEKPLYLANKVRIYPTDEQQDVLWACAHRCRLVYNFALGERKKNWEKIKDLSKKEKKKRKIKYGQQSARLKIEKEKHPEHKITHSKVLQNVLRTLRDDFESFFQKRIHGDDTAMPPGFKGKDHFYTMVYTQSGFFFENDGKNDGIRFSHKHPSGIELFFPLGRPHREKIVKGVKYLLDPHENAPVGVQIVREEEGRWFVSMIYSFKPPSFEDNGHTIGLDGGLNNLVAGISTNWSSINIKNIRPEKKNKKIQEGKQTKKNKKGKQRKPGLMSKRDHCFGANRGKKNENKEVNQKKTKKKAKPQKKGVIKLNPQRKSPKYKKYDELLKKNARKAANQNEDWQNQTSTFVLNFRHESVLLVGDLDVKEMAKRKKSTGSSVQNKKNRTLSHSVQNSGSMGRFIRLLTEKAPLFGKRIVEVDEHNTTKQCFSCGRLKKRGLDERIIQCPCGVRIERDTGSGGNIMEKFIRLKKDYANKTVNGKKVYGFLSKTPSMYEEAWLNETDLLRKTDPSERNKGGALAAIPKRFKCGKIHDINSELINIS